MRTDLKLGRLVTLAVAAVGIVVATAGTASADPSVSLSETTGLTLSAALVTPLAISNTSSASKFPQAPLVGIFKDECKKTGVEVTGAARVLGCTYAEGYPAGINDGKTNCQQSPMQTGYYDDPYIRGYNHGFADICGYIPHPSYER